MKNYSWIKEESKVILRNFSGENNPVNIIKIAEFFSEKLNKWTKIIIRYNDCNCLFFVDYNNATLKSFDVLEDAVRYTNEWLDKNVIKHTEYK